MALTSEEFDKLKTLVSTTKQLGTKMSSSEPSYLERLKSGFVKESLDIGKGFERGYELAEQGKPVQGAVRQTLAGVGGFGRIAFSPLTEALSPLITPLAEKATSNEQVQQLIQGLDEWAKQHPDAAANLKNVTDIASTLIGVKGAKVATPVVGKGAIKTLEGVAGVGQLSKATGKGVFETGIGLSAKEAPLIQAYRAKVPFLERVKTAIIGTTDKPITNADTAFRNLFGGTESMIGVQATKAKKNIWDNIILPELSKSKDVLTKEELFNPIIQKINGIKEPLKKQAYRDALNYVREAYKGQKSWNLIDAQNIKVDLTELLPESVWKGKPIGNTLKSLQKEMSGIIRKKINNSLKSIDAKTAYQDYGNLINLEKMGQKAMTGGKLKGGFGGFWSGIKDATLTPVSTLGGKTIYKIGEGIEFIGKSGAKKLKDIFGL